jgi:hypothetical protein
MLNEISGMAIGSHTYLLLGSTARVGPWPPAIGSHVMLKTDGDGTMYATIR